MIVSRRVDMALIGFFEVRSNIEAINNSRAYLHGSKIIVLIGIDDGFLTKVVKRSPVKSGFATPSMILSTANPT
jgi:hypothetical protein